jgi:hypothetical protein
LCIGVTSHNYTIATESGRVKKGRRARPLWIEHPGGWYHVSGNEQEQRSARRLRAERLLLAVVIAAIEQVKGRKWAEFRDPYGDSGRDMALFWGRRLCGLKLA